MNNIKNIRYDILEDGAFQNERLNDRQKIVLPAFELTYKILRG